MNAVEQCLFFIVAGGLAFLFFSTRKLLADLSQSEQTILEQRDEVRRLSLMIYNGQEDEQDIYDPVDDDPWDDDGGMMPEGVDDLPF